jgi:hypothetical protein
VRPSAAPDESHGPFLPAGGYEDEAQCDINLSPSPLLKHYPYPQLLATKEITSRDTVGLVQRISLDRLLLASDAPVLDPDKAQRNEPQNVWLSCLQRAVIHGVPVEEGMPIPTIHA